MFEIFFRHLARSDQIDPVIRHMCKDARISVAEHLMQTSRSVPGLCRPENNQCNHRYKCIIFEESTKVFIIGPGFFSFGCMTVLCFSHLFCVLSGIIEHIPNRHRIVDMTLVFNPKDQIDNCSVSHSIQVFQQVPVFLNGIRPCTFCMGKCRHGSIQLPEILGPDHFSPVIQAIVHNVSEPDIIFHVTFCDSIFIFHFPNRIRRINSIHQFGRPGKSPNECF